MSQQLPSLLVTVYNREHLVVETVTSIRDSSFTDFELLLVDDTSPDRSWEVIQSLAKTDPRISVFRNETNLGDYPNRRRAIELSSGNLIKFLDADDLIYPHGLGVMVDAMNRFPDAALALSHSVIDETQPYPILLSPEEAYRKHFLEGGCLSCGPSGAIFRRDSYEEVGGFRDWGVLNDIDLWLRLAAKWPVVLLPPALVWWRRHEGQEFEKGQASGEYLSKGFALVREALNSPDCPLNDGDRNRALDRAKQHHARRLIALATKGKRPKHAMKLARESGLSLPELLRGMRKYAR